jgi:hypothetical protein
MNKNFEYLIQYIFIIILKMVVSLYISDIPRNRNKEDLVQVFGKQSGFIEARLKVSNNDKRKIAFCDFETETEANQALKNLQGLKFSHEDKGISIKFSDNNKNGVKLSSSKKDGSPRLMMGRKRRPENEDRRHPSIDDEKQLYKEKNSRDRDTRENRDYSRDNRDRENKHTNMNAKYDPIQSLGNSNIANNNANQLAEFLAMINNNNLNKQPIEHGNLNNLNIGNFNLNL